MRTYHFSQPFYPGESCKKVYEWDPQTHNRSEYYWLTNPLRRVYCDMEQGVEASESCKEIYDQNPQTHNRLGYYWLINPLHCYSVTWSNDQNVAILVDGLGLLVLTLLKEMNVHLDGT